MKIHSTPVDDLYLIAVDPAMELSIRYEAARILQEHKSRRKKRFITEEERLILQRVAWRRRKNRGAKMLF